MFVLNKTILNINVFGYVSGYDHCKVPLYSVEPAKKNMSTALPALEILLLKAVNSK